MLNVEQLKSKIRLHFNEFICKSSKRNLAMEKNKIGIYITNYDLLIIEDINNKNSKELYIDYVDLELYTIEEIMEKLENFINEIGGN